LPAGVRGGDDRMSKRVVVLTDEELDLLLVWHESLEVEADRDEEDDELAEKLRALQVKA
jgi:hypothetical protein